MLTRFSCLGRSAFATRFLRDKRAVAIVEFAIVVPLLLLFGSGVFEFSRALGTSRHLTNTANSIANILATNQDGNVDYTDLHYAHDSAMLTLPDVLQDSAKKGVAWGNDLAISMAGIVFLPTVPTCTSSCTYVANVMWTADSKGRVCGTFPTSTSDSAQPSLTTLPSDLFNPVPNPQGGKSPPPFVIAVDISYKWSPLVFSKVIKPITMKRSSFIVPRYTTKITYQVAAGDDGFGNECVGF